MTVRRTLIALACLGLSFGPVLAAPASASSASNALQDASRSLRQGQTTQALEEVDRFLADKPKDAQGRFLKGTILVELGRDKEAISIFNKLIEDYPDLPEPYNNLAVIYAQQKQYEKAKRALEQAIRTHPAYATAHENLGDLYARLASQAYGKALQLDSNNTSAQTKLALIKNLTAVNSLPASRPTEPAEPSKPTSPPAPSTPVVPPTPTVIATAPSTPAAPAEPAGKPAEAAKPAKPEPKAEPKPEPKVEPKVEPKPEPKAEVKPDIKPEAKVANVEAEVNKAISAWAAAWSRKDVKAYLAHYAKDFKVPGRATRAQWEKERDRRIDKPGKIDVDIGDVKISVDAPDQVTAKFRQQYKSAHIDSATTKTLVLVKRDGKWLIQQERVGG